MCPACMAAAALTAAKVAGVGGLAAYGVKKLVAMNQPEPREPGDPTLPHPQSLDHPGPPWLSQPVS
jgi:hypothetical protein